MTLLDINTNLFYADPKHPDFVESLESQSDIFKTQIKGVDHKKLLQWIVVLYDIKSELRKIPNYPNRKLIGAIAVGFKVGEDGKLKTEVEDALCGLNNDVNLMIGQYCALSHGLNFVIYSFYSQLLINVTSGVSKLAAKDYVTVVSKLKVEIEKVEEQMFGGEEVSEMKRSLYASSKAVMLNISPEDIVERLLQGDDLSDFQPYQEGYKPNKLKYAGKKVPKE